MISAMPPTALLQHVVGRLEAIVDIGVVAHDFHQLVVEDDDQRIDVLGKFGDAGFGRLHPLAAFEAERLGDDANGQDAHFAGDLGDDRRGAGTRAATHAGGDEGHVSAFQRRADLVAMRIGGCLAGFRLGAGAEAGLAQRQLARRCCG
jgi:hypothetical protein